MINVFNRRIKKPMSEEECKQAMQDQPLEKGDFLALMIAAFIVYVPAILLAVGAILGLSYLFLYH